MHFNARKFFLIGFILLLLVGIPVSVYFVQQEQEIRSRAAPATTLSFQPDSSSGSPITKGVGEEVPLDIMIDPDSNLVSFVKLEIQYDPDKFTAANNAFQVNSAVFPTVLGGPVYTPGKIVVSMSVGTDPTKAVQTKVRAGTLKLNAIATTGEDTPSFVAYGVNTLVTSLGPNDQASENVLDQRIPAAIVITDGSEEEPTPEPTDEPIPTDEPLPTDIPTDPEIPTDNISPVCTALTADVTSGAAPLTVNFTANGTDEDDTVSKITFNFGDGQVSDVTSGGGIGTDAVNVPLAHTYSTAGTYQATGMLTDSLEGVSDTVNCSQTITVSGDGGTDSTPTPTLADAGAAEVLFGFGAVATFLIIGGALLFFLL